MHEVVQHLPNARQRAARGSGHVEFVTTATNAFTHAWRELVFARQLLGVLGSARDMPQQDRLGVLLPIIENDPRRWCDAWVEAPDSDAARELAPLCRALNAALIGAMKKVGGFSWKSEYTAAWTEAFGVVAGAMIAGAEAELTLAA